MADSRLELHEKLCELLGSRNVYFQPPASIRMQYPAIVYSLDRLNTRRADNGVYLLHHQYSVTLITKNPDTDLVESFIHFPHSSFSRVMTVDNLYHFYFSITYK